MQRSALEDLKRWGASLRRKPLIVNGARQVGKTWLVLQYGRECYDEVAHVVFLDNPAMQRVFEGSLDPDVLLEAIGAYTRTNAGSGRTLVFLDEIQECPKAVTALKFFCERRPDVPVIAAGSLLGVALGAGRGRASGVSWPVGKVEYLDMHPMTFFEFLLATGNGRYVDLIRAERFEVLDPLSDELAGLLKAYFYVGGMPEAVQTYIETGALLDARTVQRRLLLDYEHDFAKHTQTPGETERIRETWRSVPHQLTRETDSRRFVYTSVREGGRGRDYKDAVSWLVDAGLVTRVRRVSKPGIPLEAYADETLFKLYLLDIGLLGAACGLDTRTLVEGNRLFVEFKGVYAEQFVCQQLVASNACTSYYWTSGKPGSRAEVDFLYDYEGQVVPLEVKAEDNVRARSIAAFAKDHGVERCLRLSMLPAKDQGWLLNLPLWCAGNLPKNI